MSEKKMNLEQYKVASKFLNGWKQDQIGSVYVQQLHQDLCHKFDH